MIAGADAPSHGEAKNSWLTGTAAWSFCSLSQAILGIHPTYGGLRIDPCIPSDFGDFEVTRLFRNHLYYIRIQNPAHVQKGVRQILVDGCEIEGNLIPVVKEKGETRVTVIMG